MLPQEILDALIAGKISEGHTRPLLMLIDKPAEQVTLFKEMLMRKMTVREAETLARRVAYEKIRKKSLMMNPEVVDLEERLAESLGTRVHIEPREKGGKITIDYFSHDELLALAGIMKNAGKEKSHEGMFDKIKKEMNLSSNSPLANAMVSHSENINVEPHIHTLPIANNNSTLPTIEDTEAHAGEIITQIAEEAKVSSQNNLEDFKLEDDRSKEEIKRDEEREEDLYDIRNFSL